MNLNEVRLIGNLARDPECRMFANGGKVAQFGIAVNERRKNNATGEWEDRPHFFDVKAFNRGNFKLADYIEQQLRKGSKVLVVGKLEHESWTTQAGEKRSRVVIVVDQFFELAVRGGGKNGNSSGPQPDDGGYQTGPPPSFGGNEADIPF